VNEKNDSLFKETQISEIKTENFNLWCFTSMTRMKFVLFGNPTLKEGESKLTQIYELYANVTGSDPMFIVKI
jgi:hypothetical protein